MKNQRIIVGNCSQNGLYTYILKNGNLIHLKNTDDATRCTYITKCNDIIYGVLEVKDENNNGNGYIVSYKSENDELAYINKETSYGQGPCHISVCKNIIAVSNYADGYLTVYQMEKDGYIGKRIFNSRIDKEWSHMHFAQMFYDNFFLCAIDLGMNTVTVYKVNQDKLEVQDSINLGANIEPRHMVIIENVMYVVTEKSCKLYTIAFENNKLNVVKCQSILPKGVEQKDNYTGCAIKVSKDKKNIYISIRGHNSISVLKKYGRDFKIVQNVKCQGDTPRDIELDKSNRYLFVANQDSNNIAIFKRNCITGKLKFLKTRQAESPTCIITG